ncbi:MAG: hypothetical protein P4L63_00765 [Candidatus Pacebacteria bacterium]|nr:hypothetical protein [Candidatus Paceibacterota bacterium]
MENKKKMAVYIVLGVLLVVVAGFIFWSIVVSTRPQPASTGTPVALTPAVTPTPTEDTTTGSVHTGSAVTLAYADALITYANARLQLDTNCQALASPSNLVFRNNSLLMVDNRAPVTRTVHIGSVFTIKPYGFKIVKLSSSTLPATWLVDCDASQNVATITIEK